MIPNSMQLYDIHVILTLLVKGKHKSHLAACCSMFCYMYVPTIPVLSVRYIIVYANVHRRKNAVNAYFWKISNRDLFSTIMPNKHSITFDTVYER